MRLDDCYRLLDLDRRASAEEIKRAHRDLTKVWHPDRFGHDAALRRKAEEKLKAINEAYEMILASHPEDHLLHDDPGEEAPAWRIRWRGQESGVAGFQAIMTLVERGRIGEDAELLDPAVGQWAPLTNFPELRAILTRRRVFRNRNYALACALLAIVILLRRPTPAGLVIALLLFIAAGVFVVRLRISRSV